MKSINIWMIMVMLTAVSAQATLLGFSFETNPNPEDSFDGTYSQGQRIVDSGSGYYGSAISSTQLPVWTMYGTAYLNPLANYTASTEGWTPDINVGWSSSQKFATWNNGYADLTEVVYLGSDNGEYDFLVESTGVDDAKLHSFDMATYGVNGVTIDITIYDSTGSTVLWSVDDASLGTAANHVTFTPNAIDDIVKVDFSDLKGASWSYICVDNILISQVPPGTSVSLVVIAKK